MYSSDWLTSLGTYTHIFQQKILGYMPYLIQSFNDMLTNDIVSFEQLALIR